MKADLETQKVLTEGEQIRNLVRDGGWGLAKQRLTDKLIDLQSVNNIDTDDPNKLILDIQTRKGVIAIVLEWLKEIEGIAAQHDGNQIQKEDADHVIRMKGR